MAFKYKSEKKAYRIGLLAGLKKRRLKKQKRKVNKINSNSSLKEYSFQAFNSNCDVFNVVAYGKNRSEALKNAKSKLKKDPSVKSWDVEITNSPGDFDNFYRNVVIDKFGNISDNMPHRLKK